MSDPYGFGADITAALREFGEDLTLRRPGSPDIDVALKGVRFGSSVDTVVAGATRSTFEVRIGNAEIAARSSFTLPIRAQSDFIVDGDGRSYVVEEVDTKRPGGVVVAHVLKVSG